MRPVRSTLPAPRRTLDRRIVGTPAEVAVKVAILRDSDRLVYMSTPRQLPDDDRRVWVHVRFLDRSQPAATVTRQRRRRWPVAAAATGGVAVAGVGVYALVHLVNAVIALLPVIVGGLLLLALVAVIANAASGRGGRTFSGTFTGRMD